MPVTNLADGSDRLGITAPSQRLDGAVSNAWPIAAGISAKPTLTATSLAINGHLFNCKIK
jgi:hypothetical protein